MSYLFTSVVFSRRTLLKGGAGAIAALSLGGSRTAHADATPGRFDLTASPSALILKKPLYDETVMQSFAFDNVNGRIYTAQLKNGSAATNGDLCITQLSLTGTILGHMYLLGFGHGVQIGVEPSGTSAYLWTETDAVSDGTNAWGNKIARFKFVSGQTLTTSSTALQKFAPIAGATHTTCAIDPLTNHLVMRYLLNGAMRFAAYDLAAFKTGDTTRQYDVAQPTNLGTFQGYTAAWQYLYLLDGNAYSETNPPPGNTYLTSADLTTGAEVQRAFTAAWQSLDYREPEGMAIQLTSGNPRLCYGFASGTVGARTASIIYKDNLV